MRIGFEAKRVFQNYTGLGNYCRTLLENLQKFAPENEYFLYSPELRENARTAHFLNNPAFQIRTAGGKIKPLWRSFGITNDLKKDKIDVFHGLSHELPFNIRKAGIPSVVTIHDLIFERYPELYGRIDVQIYRYKFRKACRDADRIVAISEATKADIIQFYGIDPTKISVVYQSCDPSFVPEPEAGEREIILKKYNLSDPYLLYVGSVIERKRLFSAVRALENVPENLCPKLAVIGEGGAYLHQIKKFIAEKGLQKRVVFLENTPFSDFPALYRQARALVYPSVCEGFGIPVIEALSVGTPVITSPFSALPEAAGPDQFFVDPDDISAFTELIISVLTDEPALLAAAEKGLEYVKRFSAERTAGDLLGLYEKISALRNR